VPFRKKGVNPVPMASCLAMLAKMLIFVDLFHAGFTCLFLVPTSVGCGKTG